MKLSNLREEDDELLNLGRKYEVIPDERGFKPFSYILTFEVHSEFTLRDPKDVEYYIDYAGEDNHFDLIDTEKRLENKSLWMHGELVGLQIRDKLNRIFNVKKFFGYNPDMFKKAIAYENTFYDNLPEFDTADDVREWCDTTSEISTYTIQINTSWQISDKECREFVEKHLKNYKVSDVCDVNIRAKGVDSYRTFNDYFPHIKVDSYVNVDSIQVIPDWRTDTLQNR